MTTHCDSFRRRRKRVRVAASDRLSNSRRRWAALCGPVTTRQMTPEERQRCFARRAPDPYERSEPP